MDVHIVYIVLGPSRLKFFEIQSFRKKKINFKSCPGHQKNKNFEPGKSRIKNFKFILSEISEKEVIFWYSEMVCSNKKIQFKYLKEKWQPWNVHMYLIVVHTHVTVTRILIETKRNDDDDDKEDGEVKNQP